MRTTREEKVEREKRMKNGAVCREVAFFFVFFCGVAHSPMPCLLREQPLAPHRPVRHSRMRHRFDDDDDDHRRPRISRALEVSSGDEGSTLRAASATGWAGLRPSYYCSTVLFYSRAAPRGWGEGVMGK